MVNLICVLHGLIELHRRTGTYMIYMQIGFDIVHDLNNGGKDEVCSFLHSIIVQLRIMCGVLAVLTCRMLIFGLLIFRLLISESSSCG